MPFRRRLMTWLLVLFALYVAIVALAWAMQDRLLFVGKDWGKGQPVHTYGGVRVERLALPDGGTFRVAIGEPRGPLRGGLVFFMGNGEDLRSGVAWAALWGTYGQRAVVVEYPGYGDSDGVPGKASFFAAADVAAARARELAPGVPLTAAGSSLGSFSAVHLAAEEAADRVVLRAPPWSIERIAKASFWWLPVHWFLRHDFDNGALAARVRCPTLIVHGDRDQVVPLAHGRELCEALAGPSEFVVAAGYDHNDLPFERSGPFGPAIVRLLDLPR